MTIRPFILLLVCLSMPAAEPAAKPLPRALVIGDSICISGYATALQEELKGRVEVLIGAAQSSAMTLKGIDGTLQHHLRDGKADVIHFNCGLWDMCIVSWDGKGGFHDDTPKGRRMVAPIDYERNLREFVRILKGRTDRLVWGTITPIPDTPGRHQGDDYLYNAIAAVVMKENGVLIDDLHAAMLPHVDRYQGSHDVHFNQEGSAFLARKVAGAILDALSGELKPQVFASNPDKPYAIGAVRRPATTAPQSVRPEIRPDQRQRGVYAFHEMQDKSLLVGSTTGWRWRITAYDHYVLRIQVARAGEAFPPGGRMPVVHHPGQVSDLTVEEGEGELRIRTWATDGIPLILTKQDLRAQWPWAKGPLQDQGGLAGDGTTVTWDLRHEQAERFFALADGSDITGTAVTCPPAGSAAAAIPGFLSSRDYGMVVNVDQAVRLNLGREGRFTLSYDSADQPMDLFVIVGKDRDAVTQRIRAITAR